MCLSSFFSDSLLHSCKFTFLDYYKQIQLVVCCYCRHSIVVMYVLREYSFVFFFVHHHLYPHRHFTMFFLFSCFISVFENWSSSTNIISVCFWLLAWSHTNIFRFFFCYIFAIFFCYLFFYFTTNFGLFSTPFLSHCYFFVFFGK